MIDFEYVSSLTLEMVLNAVQYTYEDHQSEDIGWAHRLFLSDENCIRKLSRLLGFRASLESEEGIYIYAVCLFMTRKNRYQQVWFSENAKEFVKIYGKIPQVKRALVGLPDKLCDIFLLPDCGENARLAAQHRYIPDEILLPS